MENLKIDCCGFTDKQKQEVVWELNRLGFITGHKSVDFYCFIYGCTGNTSYNNTIQFGNTAKTFAKNKGREVTLDELKQIPSEGSQTEQGLISGADAELVERSKKFITPDHLNRFQAAQAHLEGKPVQFMTANGDFIDITDNSTVGIFATDGGYSFRLKPRTIKLEIEIPAPFEPKVGDPVYFIDHEKESGWSWITSHEHLYTSWYQFGAWRTEEEIKQVVAALRGALKND